MSKRLYTELSVLYTRDTAQRQKLLDECITIDELDDITGHATEMVSRYFELAASAADVAISVDQLTNISTLVIVADADITVKLNGTGSPAIPVRGIPADTSGNTTSEFQRQTQPGLVFWRGRIDSVHLGNPNATVAPVTIIMIGDAA